MCFHLVTQKKNVAVRFETKKGQDTIDEITSCKYVDSDNELLID